MAPFSKPETVLKQAEGLVSVGQNHAALQSLSEMFSSKRFRSTPLSSLEPIMLRFMELCVEMRKGRAAKEGLMQYKNIAQNSSVGSIQVVVTKFIEMAEARVKEAQGRAEKAAIDVEDLEAPSTPESILLSSVSFSSSSDPSKDRTDRALVTPSLKFLWESYRTSLETLKNNSRLEGIYTDVALAAFKFCLSHVRKVEFRRLCDTLRLHLSNVGKYAHQPHSINLSDPDTLQKHLDIRFSQLNTSVELELWQEAFRSVEDIHNLLSMAPKKTLGLKQEIMAGYYEKLSRIFLMSGNALYHAAACGRYYELAGGKTDEERAGMAAKVVVSALAVPVGSNANSGGSSQQSRLTALLNLPKPPTRSGLLKDALARDVLRLSPPTVKKLYQALEVDFDPLTLCENVAPLLAELASEKATKTTAAEATEEDPYAPYLPLLHQALLSRLLAHLSEVYSSIKIENLIQLVAPLKTADGRQIFTATQVESYIMGCARRGELNVRVDHAEGCIVFIDEPFAYASNLGDNDGEEAITHDDGYRIIQPSATVSVKTKLSSIAGILHHSLQVLEGQGLVEPVAPTSESHEDRIKNLLANLPAYRKQLLLHQSLTARRRQLQQELAARAAAQNQTMQAEAMRKAKDAALAHSLAEAREREASRRKAEMERIRREEAEKYAKGLVEGGVIGKDVVEKIQSSTEPLDTTELIKMQVLALEKDKTLRASRLKTISKRIDHLERAFRVSELPLLKSDYERQQNRDREAHLQMQNDLKAEVKSKWEEDMEAKKRLGKIYSSGEWDKRKEALVKKKGEEFALKREKAQRKIEAEKNKRKEEFLNKKEEEKKAEKAKEEEERRREEEEQENARAVAEAQAERDREAALEREREEEEQRKKQEEEEKAEKEKEEKRKEREAERQKTLEQVRLQREREEEAERRRAQRAQEKAGEKSKPAVSSPFGAAGPASDTSGGGVWRRRTAAAESPSGTPASSLPSTPTRTAAFGSRADIPRSGSPAPAAPAKYKPGQGMGGGGGWRAREDAKTRGEIPTPPSRTESPAPPTSNRASGIFGSGTPKDEKADSKAKEEDDGFTVVGGEKKNVWKPKRLAGGR